MLQTNTVIVTADDSDSTICDSGINNIVAFGFPSEMTSTSVSFAVSVDNDTYYDLTDKDGNTFEIPVSAQSYVVIPPEISYAIPRFIQLRFSDAELAERTIQIFIREV